MARQRFWRSLALTVANEARLLGRDPVSLLMLVIAPVVIMTVAGYSLGELYGAHPHIMTVPIVDHDGGAIVDDLIEATPPDARMRFERSDDVATARRRILDDDYAPLAIEVPAGTSATLATGSSAALVLYIDPARRLEVNALELELGVVQRRAAAAVRARAQRALAESTRELRHALVHLERALRRAHRHVKTRIAAAARDAVTESQARVATAMARSRRDVEAALTRGADGARAAVRGQLQEREAALGRVAARLDAFAAVRPDFERWLAALHAKAGSHAAEIPPPPAFPEAPADADLALLARPIDLPSFAPTLPPLDAGTLVAPTLKAVTRRTAAAVHREEVGVADALRARFAAGPPALPGTLDAFERPAVDGVDMRVNAFDQYVPGFGVTFLLIGMMLGISLTLFDEREWGTLERVRAGGASLAGILIGKVMARAAVGVVQMLVLFGVGWALFDVTLGQTPAALLLPMVSMAFAGAALGLVIPSLAPAHDSVMPLGTVTSLAMAAIGGCWWPLDFEPAWMRTLAHWLPTTWTMQAYNDLMIRGAPASAAFVPFGMTMAIGAAILAIGVAAALGTLRARE